MALGIFLGCSDSSGDEIRYQPSGYEIYLPSDKRVPFSTYIEENRYRIQQSVGRIYEEASNSYFSSLEDSSKKPKVALTKNLFSGVPLKKLVDYRSPEQHLPSRECERDKDLKQGYRTGFLLLHGLTDSPFSLKETRKRLQESLPCAVYRHTVMPGHATVPGDANEVAYTEWIDMLDYALHQYLGEVDRLFLVGYSTGFAVSLEHVLNDGVVVEGRFGETETSYEVKGLIGYSPALKISVVAKLAPYIKLVFDYLDTYLDQDPVKYESFNLNLVAQLSKLLGTIDLDKELTVPTMMVVSSDDVTVDPVANYDYYCQKVKAEKRMIWYQGLINIFNPCEGMEVIKAEDRNTKVKNIAHTAIPFSPDNPVYGYQKKYAYCLSYFGEKIRFEECKKETSKFIYGESNLLQEENLELIKDRFFRRGTFNPHFDSMMESTVQFVLDKIEPVK